MTRNLTLGKMIAKEIVDDGYPSDPSDPNVRHVHLGDLEAIIDAKLEWWLINVYDVDDDDV